MCICRTPALAAVVDEVVEIFCDKAEAIFREALESEHEGRRDVASRFVLSGKGAQRGGLARPSEPAVTVEQPPRQLTLKWLDGTEFGMERGGDRALIDARPGDDGERSSE
jgi:hypothetical protein